MNNKNKQFLHFAVLFILAVGISCSNKGSKNAIVQIETNYGNIEIKLYNETPKHRDNFIKLIDSGYYDSTIFHRVIKDFVIQGGDPQTKTEVADTLFGEGGPNYTIEAEFIDTLYHKRGALGMAREGDDINPLKKSSGSQFYIVIGKKFDDEDFKALQQKMYKRKYDKFYQDIKAIKTAEFSMNYKKIDTVKLNYAIKTELDSIMSQTPTFQLTEKQEHLYRTIGGIPHLDHNYTVFGEVTKGMDVVERISLTKTNDRDIPVQPIKMTIRVKNRPWKTN